MIRAAYLGTEWIGPPRGQIDQLKEGKAARERVDMGISTLAEETAALTGGDWERKHQQRAKEMRLRLDAGLEETKEVAVMPEEDPEDEDDKNQD